MLCGCLVEFVLHLEHNRNVLCITVEVAEDEVSLASSGSVVILFEICIREHRTHLTVEYVAAMGLKGFSDHFCGHLQLQVLVIIHLLLSEFELGFILVLEGVLLQFGLSSGESVPVLQLCYLQVLGTVGLKYCFIYFQSGLFLDCLQISFQTTDFLLLCKQFLIFEIHFLAEVLSGFRFLGLLLGSMDAIDLSESSAELLFEF